jgi:hypothetical protein
MKTQLKIVLAAALAALTTAGCVAMEDRPREILTPSGVQQDTYIPHGTAPYGGIDPYNTNSRRGTAAE